MSHLFVHVKGRYQSDSNGLIWHSKEAEEAFRTGPVYGKVHGQNGALYIDPTTFKVQGYFGFDSKGKPMPEKNAALVDGSFKQSNGATYSFEPCDTLEEIAKLKKKRKRKAQTIYNVLQGFES